jgi:hypothetical protein
MQVECNKCQGHYHARSRFSQERLWRLTCPHCGAAMWVSAPVSDAQPAASSGGELPRSRWSVPRALS